MRQEESLLRVTKVKKMGAVYVADRGNDGLMRWQKGTDEGEILAGGNGPGSQKEQLSTPTSIARNDQGNLYVVDRGNQRIQRFDIE